MNCNNIVDYPVIWWNNIAHSVFHGVFYWIKRVVWARL